MADVHSQATPNLPRKSGLGATEAGSPKSMKKTPPEAPDTKSNGFDDGESDRDETYTNGEHDDGATETGGNGPAAETEDPEEDSEAGEAAEAIPAGSVGEEGRVIDREGKVIGHVSDQGIPEGSMVDQEGDVLDEEGNVIGRAEPLDDVSKDVQKGPESIDREQETEGIEPDKQDPTAEGIEATDTEQPVDAEKAADESEATLPDVSILEGMRVNKLGKIVDEEVWHIDSPETALTDYNREILSDS